MERYLNDEQDQKCMHEQGYTQTDLEEFDRIELERKKYVATLEEMCYCRGQYTIVLPNRGGGSNTMKTEEHPEYQQLAQ